MSDTNTQTGTRHIQMNMAQSFKVGRWLKKRPDASSAQDDVLANAASTELGFPITKNNIKAVREALGIGKAAQRRAPKSADILVASIVTLYNSLGLEVPADLAALKKKE